MKQLCTMHELDYFTYNNYVYKIVSFELDSESVQYVHCKTCMFLAEGQWQLSQGGHRERFNPYVQVEPCVVMPIDPKGLWLATDNNRHAVFTSLDKAKEWLAGTDWIETELGHVSKEVYRIVSIQLM